MKRISMARARKLYNEGVHIYLLPSKAVPGSIWILPIRVSLNEDDDMRTFDSEVNAYRYYNCNKYVGMRVHFYIEE